MPHRACVGQHPNGRTGRTRRAVPLLEHGPPVAAGPVTNATPRGQRADGIGRGAGPAPEAVTSPGCAGRGRMAPGGSSTPCPRPSRPPSTRPPGCPWRSGCSRVPASAPRARRARALIALVGTLCGVSLFLGGALAHLGTVATALALVAVVVGAAVAASGRAWGRSSSSSPRRSPRPASRTTTGGPRWVGAPPHRRRGIRLARVAPLARPRGGPRPPADLPPRAAMVRYGLLLGIGAAIAYLLASGSASTTRGGRPRPACSSPDRMPGCSGPAPSAACSPSRGRPHRGGGPRSRPPGLVLAALAHWPWSPPRPPGAVGGTSRRRSRPSSSSSCC